MLNAATIRIVRDIRDWLSGRDAEWLPDGNETCCLEILLQARVDWLDRPDPTLWRTGDVHRLLVDTAAARLTDAYALTEHGPAVLRVLVDFLDDTDRFHPASMRVAALRKELDRAAAKFPVAMSDESRWRLAKRVFLAMGSEGIDLADEAAVDAWAAEFSRAGADRRRSVLGVLLDREPEFLACRFVIRDNTVAAIAAGEPVPAQFRRHDPDTCADCLDSPANPPIAPAADRRTRRCRPQVRADARLGRVRTVGRRRPRGEQTGCALGYRHPVPGRCPRPGGRRIRPGAGRSSAVVAHLAAGAGRRGPAAAPDQGGRRPGTGGRGAGDGR